jgi:heme/copper-type cytochrome/quinol oxidase subunit 2
MNKYIIIGLSALVLLGVGFGFSKLKTKSDKVVESTGKVVNITVRAVKNEWRWDITNVQVNAGDSVHLTLINEDDYDHGIGIDGYGINERMPASRTVEIDFVATRKGKFNFYCSVPCGKGKVANPKSPFDGEERDHFDMLGALEVI